VPDLNMNDDMVKLVRLRFLYTEPDAEQMLTDGPLDVLVNYRTTADQFGGQQMALFIGRVQANPGNYPRFNPRMLDPDRVRYIKISLEVIDRFPKEDGYYDRRSTQALEGIGAVLQARL